MMKEEIKLSNLINENIEEERNINCTHLLIQILRIITPQTVNLGNVLTCYQKNQ